jgi:anti-sigma factor RsiW
MSSVSQRHPEDGLLLRYLDGELPSAESRQIQDHLEACWQCRTELEHLQATVADCMRYRKQVLETHLPEAPNPWIDLSRELDRIDESLAAQPFWTRLLPRTPSLRWSLAAAALIALVCGVFYQLRETPSVHAATLLKRAVAAAAHNTQPARRYTIRMGGVKIIRAAAKIEAPLPIALSARFAAAHYDSADPLSAASFQTWRDSLAVKTDAVSTISGGTGSESYRIQTSTPDGEVASATLTLRSSDLHPLDGALEFRDRQTIEFTELTEPPAVSDGTSAANNVEVPVRSSVPSGKAAFAPTVMASISDELQVLSALHQIGADLGDPIEVKRSGGRVLVSGVGVPAQHQKQLHDMLDSLPNVSVDFANPAAVSSGEPATTDAAAAAESTRSAPAGSRVQTTLEQQLGSRAEFEKFSSQILDGSDAAMSRAYALHLLAQRVTTADEAQLSAAGRRELRAIAAEHAAALATQISAIQRVLDPVLISMGAPAHPKPAAAEASAWQPAAEDTFRASRRVEVLLSLLLGVAPSQGSAADLPAQLMTAVTELRADLDRCQRLLAQ